ncbi:hypothetical protein ACFFKU_00125 [Kineococcus gynurae]|uniref:Flp pilus assembly pilin Flp n=1 Tax=Kineococcus gynurae TaxID=452979 RepID=A0ABV5LXN3_9ACTN
MTATLVRTPAPRRTPSSPPHPPATRTTRPSPRLLGLTLLTRLRHEHRTVRDLGASALEWAVIAAVVVVAASVIGGVVYGIVQQKSAALQTCASAAVGTSC